LLALVINIAYVSPIGHDISWY